MWVFMLGDIFALSRRNNTCLGKPHDRKLYLLD
ncbi:hypothetical protein EMIT0P44_20143 [Pseudomonas sp. IT-P44]